MLVYYEDIVMKQIGNHLVDVLKYDLRENILDIDEELKISYQLKELFLDITHHATYENVKSQLINWISLVREQNIEEMSEAANTIEKIGQNTCAIDLQIKDFQMDLQKD